MKAINQTSNPTLTRAVAKQCGGFENLKEIAADVCNHGASSGFGGFIYYSETAEFYAKNRKAILQNLEDLASNLGENAIAIVKGFRCLNGDYSEAEIGATLYGSKNKHETAVANALAWYALEEVCRDLTDG
jgi:hypothetical protein